VTAETAPSTAAMAARLCQQHRIIAWATTPAHASAATAAEQQPCPATTLSQLAPTSNMQQL
jgi:hypothetical protein